MKHVAKITIADLRRELQIMRDDDYDIDEALDALRGLHGSIKYIQVLLEAGYRIRTKQLYVPG